ncbi:MAG TPA: protease pro-enzyme activation domain-containing protein, partial [Thermoplasmata archaeon]|nr:protease pro-enzyme activation domain-containing protein [Thermoplasmata archaeon]
MMFTVGFSMRNSALLESILSSQSAPGNPYYRHWLTYDEESQMFGPDPTTVQETVNYFTSLGFHVSTRGLLSISFQGTVGQVDQAFQTQIVDARTANGSVFMSPQLPTALPAPLATSIASLNGLDTLTVAHPEHFVAPFIEQLPAAEQARYIELAASTNWTNAWAAFNVSNHPFMWIYSPHHHYDQFISMATLDSIYNASPLLQQGYTGNSTGTRINIAIVMGGGINPDDLETFSNILWGNPYQLYNPNPALSRLVAVPVDGTFTTNGTLHYVDGLSGEMALDMEYSSTMAPGARITAVYGPCLCTNVLDDDYAKVLAMTPIPTVVSNSWGGDEDGWPNLYGPNWNNAITMHNYFMLIDARGSSVIASSGDGGGFDVATGMLAPSFPASDPYVLSVNGLRTAVADAAGKIFPTNPDLGIANITISEEPNNVNGPVYLPNYPTHVARAAQIAYQQFWYVPFSNYTLLRAPPEASGGMGTSYWFNQSWWQHGWNVPDLGRSLGSGIGAEADFNETIFFDGGWEFFFGGTSFACPTVAGELAVVADYLLAHGLSPYFGNVNTAVWLVANAWYNGNLTLNPFYDVTLGASYWANQGESAAWSWPPGQKLPHTPSGYPDYGNTSVGFDFPTGWGSMDVNNFAIDLYHLYTLPGQFAALSGSSWAPQAWANFAVNQTYTLHVNATPSLVASSPKVTVVYHPESGSPISVQPAITYTTTPSAGYSFTLDTSSATYGGPGYVIFEIGNASNPSSGFAYSWLAPHIPAGTLAVTVTSPGSSSIPGGYPEYNWALGIGFNFPGAFGPFYPNTFTVHVTLNGNPVYNAVVTAQIASAAGLPAWAGSQAQAIYNFRGASVGGTTMTMSQSFTNLTGDALVYTWNVWQPTTYYVNATFGPNRAATTYDVTPPPNIVPWDNYG